MTFLAVISSPPPSFHVVYPVFFLKFNHKKVNFRSGLTPPGGCHPVRPLVTPLCSWSDWKPKRTLSVHLFTVNKAAKLTRDISLSLIFSDFLGSGARRQWLVADWPTFRSSDVKEQPGRHCSPTPRDQSPSSCDRAVRERPRSASTTRST